MAMASTTYLFIMYSLAMLLVIGSVCKDSAAASQSTDDVAMSIKHNEWMAQHKRMYKDEAERQYRFKIFKDNVEYIELVNGAGDRKYTLGINKFADLTNEEFRNIYTTGFKPKLSSTANRVRETRTPFRYANLSSVPPTVDWRKKGAVNPIKDQGACGSCWAFSAVASTEGIIKLKTGNLISLSEQELVDCVSTKDTNGCNGGEMDDAFEFIIKMGGLTTEAKYPYKDGDGKCVKVTPPTAVAKIISTYEDVPPNSESSLMMAVANQPVSVGIDGRSKDFAFYASGVYHGPCATVMEHAVTTIGYGTESDGTKFWLVKNSWGTSWGEKGFGKIERGIAPPHGRCGIAKHASYPTA